MYTIVYLFGKRIQEYIAFSDENRDQFLKSLKEFGIKILAVRYRLC